MRGLSMRRMYRTVLALAGGFVIAASGIANAAGDPPLVEAARGKNDAAVRRLLQQSGIEVNARDADGATALHWAVYNDDEAAVRALLNAGAKANLPTEYGIVPLALAAQNGNGTLADLLLKAG